jgi:hypothetical protein
MKSDRLYFSPIIIMVIKSRRMRWELEEGDKKCIQKFGR